MRAFRSLKSFRGGAQFSTWLFSILLNLCRSAAARRSRRPSVSEPARYDERPSFEPSADAQTTDPPRLVERAETQRLVQEALVSLPPHYREVATLYEIEGLPYEEISAVLRVPVGTVRSRLNRARLMLRERLRGLVELG